MLRPETKTSIPFPAKKRAAKSEFSLNFSTTSDNEYSVNGPESLVPELPYEGGFTALVKYLDNAASRRTEGIEYNLLVFIISRTTSASRRPEYARISINDYRQRTGKSERMIYLALGSLEGQKFIEFDENRGVKVCAENLLAAPLPAARTCRRRTKAAAVHAAASIAALMAPAAPADDRTGETLKLTSVEREIVLSEIQETERQFPKCDDGEIRGGIIGSTANLADAEPDRAVGDVGSGQGASSTECLDGGFDRVDESGTGRADGASGSMDSGFVVFDSRAGYGLYLVRHKLAARLKLTSVKAATNFKKAATYCTWNWTCPHLSTASPLVSIETRNIEPTTTAAGQSSGCGEKRAEQAASGFPDALENAYLARFLQPATRIGELLEIDDAAAGRMWTECAARNARLTPREFVIIVRAKLAEWRRVDDARPGLKVRTMTGLLITSMPNAVLGALYMAAHEQAPAEIERDCADARRILAGNATPRDRAWARAILAEAGEHGET